MPSRDEIIAALFAAGGGGGAWMLCRFGYSLSPQWSCAAALVFAGLVYSGIEYGKGGQ